MIDLARFRSMGCEVLVCGASTEELARIEALFVLHERVFSRFFPGSELNRVNAAAGHVVAVSPLFASVLDTALRMAEETDGLVDPTVGAAIVAAGYDRDFALLGDDPCPATAVPAAGWRSVRAARGLIRTPAGVRLDLNGVVKALAIDAAAKLISAGGWVSAGGDLAATAPVEVALPGAGAVRLEQGGLATSGSVKRRWMRGGRPQHHLIDPATGAPSTSPWTQVTVCGATCLAADVAAKAAFLMGEDGPGWLERRLLPARFVSRAGEAVNDTWLGAMRGARECI